MEHLFKDEEIRLGSSSRTLRMTWALALMVVATAALPFILLYGYVKQTVKGTLITLNLCLALIQVNWRKTL